MKSPSLFSLSVRSDREEWVEVEVEEEGETAVMPGCQNFPSEPEQKICPDKRLRVTKSRGWWRRVRLLLQSSLILCEVISSSLTQPLPSALWPLLDLKSNKAKKTNGGRNQADVNAVSSKRQCAGW